MHTPVARSVYNLMEHLYISGIKIASDIPKDSYLQKIPMIQFLLQNNYFSFRNAVTFFVGDNGVGKSTLLEALAVGSGLNAEGGSRNFNFSTYHTESELYKYLTIIKKNYEKDGFFLRAESFYNVATNIIDNHLNLDGYGGKSLHEQSHGESFLSLVQNRFRGNGLYILDEPEAALSPTRQMTLLLEIKRLVEMGSQFIIATHSPIVLAYPDAIIFEISNAGINEKQYNETETYQVMNKFVNEREKMIHYLFDK